MSTKNRFADRNRDQNDGVERHIYSEMESVEGGGHVVKVKGTGTEDDECVVLNIGGVGMRFPKDTNAEVHVLSGGSDTNLKFAVICIPHDKEHKWKEGQNGLQKWDDPKKRVQFDKKRIHATDNFAARADGVLEVVDGRVYVRGDLYVQGQVKAVVVPPAAIPAFDAE